jgi:hypothetical protein
MKTVLIAYLVMFVGIAMICAGHEVSSWEKTNHYPFGRLCDLYGNC